MIKPEELEALKKELSGICLFVTSTFGNGDPPRTGEALAEWIDVQLTKMEASQHNRMASSSTTSDYEVVDDGPSKSLYRRIAMAKKQILGDLRLVFGNKTLYVPTLNLIKLMFRTAISTKHYFL